MKTTLNWSYPYKLNKENYKNILENDFFNNKGVYIWAYKSNNGEYYVHYIGKTNRNFRKRFYEHLNAAFDGKCYIYDMHSNNNLIEEIKRLAHKSIFDDKELEKKNISLRELGEKYISELEFFFCSLTNDDDINKAESYLINKVKDNNSTAFKLFFINDVVPEQYKDVKFENNFLDDIRINF